MDKKRRFEMKIAETLYSSLEDEAKKTGNSIASIVRSAICDHVYGKVVKE